MLSKAYDAHAPPYVRHNVCNSNTIIIVNETTTKKRLILITTNFVIIELIKSVRCKNKTNKFTTESVTLRVYKKPESTHRLTCSTFIEKWEFEVHFLKRVGNTCNK